MRKARQKEFMRLTRQDALCRHSKSMFQNYTLTEIVFGNCLTETLTPTKRSMVRQDPLGKNTLGTKMSKFSREANLSRA